MRNSKMDTKHNPALDRQFAALKAALDGQAAPPELEQALQAAWAKRYEKRPWYRRLTLDWVSGAAGVAASASAALLVLVAVQQPASGPATYTALQSQESQRAPFIALQSAERLASEASPRLLQADLPRAIVASLGVPVSPDMAGDTLRAELLVSRDGEPLALRLAAN
jgi:hypothetical protein